jgi:hypothetical protein
MGSQRILSTGESPDITVDRARGDLTVSGWNRPEVSIKCDDERFDVVHEGGVVRVNFSDDCTIQAPFGTTLRVNHCDGDAQIVSVQGAVTVGDVGGDLDLRDVGVLALDQVGGDFVVKGGRGDCTVGHVGGDANVANVLGSVSVEHIGGDLDVRDVGAMSAGSVGGDFTIKSGRGDCTVRNVGNDASVVNVLGSFSADHVGNDLSVSDVRGSVRASAGDDVSLRLLLQPGCDYTVSAGNDLVCRIQTDASARVNMSAGNEIVVRKLATPNQRFERAVSLLLGDGEASLNLTAGDDITLIGLTLDELGELMADLGVDVSVRAAEMAQQIAAQIEVQIGSVARQIDEKLAQFGTGEELAVRIQEKIQGALRRAEERVGEALRNAETRQREAERRAAETAARQRSQPIPYPAQPTPPSAPKPPKPPKPPVSEDERMLVLRMVSEGKISVEQAEKLLAALNG